MARPTDLERMSHTELKQLEVRIERLKAEARRGTRRSARTDYRPGAENGFDVRELIGNGRGGNGSVAAKYRDPSNPANTWTGRGRMPRWMAAAMKSPRVKKEDFLIR